MIETIVFNKNYNGFAKTSCIDFKPGVNLIVGDQGCGKSTLLAQISAYKELVFEKKRFSHKCAKECVIDLIWSGDKAKFGYFDFEKHNPRTQPGFGMGFGYDTGYQVQSLFVSHGQAIKPLVMALFTATKEKQIAVLDEPDTALSMRSVIEFIKALNKFEDKNQFNSQIILSTHNPLLISSFKEVLSLEHGKWMTSSEFIKSQEEEQAPIFEHKKYREIVAMRHKPVSKEQDFVNSLMKK